MKNIILAVIGGGSVNWMRGLMRDVYLIDEADGGEIRLVDPNTEHVEAVAQMLEKFNEVRGKHYRISVVENRREALKGADFVMTTFSPGAMPAFRNDLEIPIKYGLRLPVSMTVGIPGISAAIRTAPVMQEIVQDMEQMCPGAWLLNVTNPMSVVTKAMCDAAKTIHPIGMCHEFHALGNYLGPIFGLHRPKDMDVLTYLYRYLGEQGFDYTVAGINHFIWLTKADYNGRNVLPDIVEYAKTHTKFEEEAGANVQATNTYVNQGQAKLALCRQFGYLPIPGDRHLVEFYPSLCNARNGFGMKYNVRKTTVDSRVLDKYLQLNEIREVADGRRKIDWTRSSEEMTEIMRAILSGTNVTAIINTSNHGQISNMPENTVVETLATVGADGIQPWISGEIPGAPGALCRLHGQIQDMVTEASLTGDRRLLLEAMSMDPGAGAGVDFSEIPALMEELLEANRQWLPRFFE